MIFVRWAGESNNMACGTHQYDGSHPLCEKCGQHRQRETVEGQHVCRPCSRVLRGWPPIKPTEVEK